MISLRHFIIWGRVKHSCWCTYRPVESHDCLWESLHRQAPLLGNRNRWWKNYAVTITLTSCLVMCESECFLFKLILKSNFSDQIERVWRLSVPKTYFGRKQKNVSNFQNWWKHWAHEKNVQQIICAHRWLLRIEKIQSQVNLSHTKGSQDSLRIL